MIKEMLIKENKELEKIEERVKRNLLQAPAGFLRIIRKKGRMECYYKEDNGVPGANGRYMKKSELSLACQIAQRDYDNLILRILENRKNAIELFLMQYGQSDLAEAYKKTGELRRTLIKPWKLPDGEFMEAWEEVKYVGKKFEEDIPFVYTEKGEKVRSKSEKIIADKLYAMQIPYRYEYPVKLKGCGVVYPDFCVLNVRTRKEYYLEHFGMMDNPEYVEKAIAKVNAYMKNKICLGDKLLLTFETKKQPLDTKALEMLFREKFL